MKTLIGFYEDLCQKIGIEPQKHWKKLTEVEICRHIISNINRYFYQNYEGIGQTDFNGEMLDYFSDFHKFWEKYHAEILEATIDEEHAEKLADVIHEALQKHGFKILNLTHDTCGIPKQAIAQVRFFTANQDWREPPEDPYRKYLDDPTRFDADYIFKKPLDFLKYIDVAKLSQTDKRIDYAKNAAKLLMDNGITAYELGDHFGKDALLIRDELIRSRNTGYGEKKTDMFIRDMVVLGVWKKLKNYDAIDVASDINTMKLALRTGLLKTKIQLISSFLDIFCHQYGYIDEMNALAWRRVWEILIQKYGDVGLSSPCELDFFLYRIGREYCKNNLCEYLCEEGHRFYHFGAAKTLCKVCKGKAHPIARYLPCQVDNKNLPRDLGAISLDSELFQLFDGYCIFEGVCKPRSKEFEQHSIKSPMIINTKGKKPDFLRYNEKDLANTMRFLNV
jgi:hypothetical protein